MARNSALMTFDTQAITSELERRHARRVELIRERSRVAREIQQLTKAITAHRRLYTTTLTPEGAVPKNEIDLAGVLYKIIGTKTMSAPELAAEALKTGYRSRSTTFTKLVSHALARSQRLKRVSRGYYTRS
jgi:hypothetical protein